MADDDLEGPNIDRGVALEEAGDADGAAAIYREVIARVPGHAIAHYNLGVVQFKLGRLAQAIAAFDAAIAADPGDASAYYNRGVCHGQVAAAAGNLRIDGAGLTAVGGAGLARYARAIDDYTRALAIDERPHVLVNRAVARHKLGQDADAIADLRRAIALGDPRAPRALKDFFGLDA